MRVFLDKVVSFFKKEPFEIDKRIPFSYLFLFFGQKVIDLFWGFIVFKFRGRVFLNPSSVIRCSRMISFNSNLVIARGCYLNALSEKGIKFGRNVSVGKYSHLECTGNMKYLGKGIIIGDNVGLGTHGHFGGAGGLVIGSDTIIGNYVSFHPESHNYCDVNRPIRLQGVSHLGIVIGRNCWIGAKATFLDGAEIGDSCIVAAGAVVKGKFPDNVVIGGIPAKIIKSRI
jgi:acetyltransferase-like isoleucine patch superfamily enzyme